MDDRKWERSQGHTNGLDTEFIEFATGVKQPIKESDEIYSDFPEDLLDLQYPTGCENHDVKLKNNLNQASSQSAVPPAASDDAVMPLTRQLKLNSLIWLLSQRVAAFKNIQDSSGPAELDGSEPDQNQEPNQNQSSISDTRVKLASGCVFQPNGLVGGPRARPADAQSIGEYYSTFKTDENGEVVHRLDRYYCLKCDYQSRRKGDTEKHSKIHGPPALSCRSRGCKCTGRKIFFRHQRGLEKHLLVFKDSGGGSSRKKGGNDENKSPKAQSPKQERKK
uniref:Uncharacterized protein n=1 Tax=Psilocybe cubensis TaxID=181762 RepID=A0A8H7XJL9_PSICU